MQLIVISSEAFFEGETAIVNTLFENGLIQFHLRKPGASKEQIADYIEAINPERRKNISLHGWHELWTVYNVGGIHYPEMERKATSIHTLSLWRTKGLRLSTSVHTIAEAKALDPVFEYCFLSPVFNSISKPGYPSGFDGSLSVMNNAVATIALGGVTNKNIMIVKEMEFAGAALLGHLWQYPDIAIERFVNLKKIM